jgi:hypothetical protein
MTFPLRHEAALDLADDLPDGGDLLARAFAACLLQSLERSSTTLRFRYDHAAVRATVERHGSPPCFSRLAYELELETDEPPGRVDLLHRSLLRQGPVTSTLAKALEIEGSVRVRERAAAAV